MPVQNECAYVRAALSSILSQDYPKEALEILVIEGASDDGTPDVIQALAAEHPQVRCINNADRIVATALNAGIQNARAEIIVRMDAHTEYAADYIAQCVTLLLQVGADNVGGPWVPRGTTRFSRAVAAAFQSPIGSGGARAHDPSYEGWVDTVYLGCWRKELFRCVGLFAQDLVRHEDDEHNLRLIRSGGRIWQSPRIRSWYQPRGSLAELFHQYSQNGYWKIRIVQKHGRPASLRHVIPGAYILATLLLAMATPWSSIALGALLLLLGAHLTLNTLASVLAASRGGWGLLPWLPVVFYCFHLAYGYGSLCGLLDFVVLRRGAQPQFGQSTRRPQTLGLGEKWSCGVADRSGDGRSA